MKKLLMFFAMVMTSITMMAQSQFYVILKDGSGASYPESIVDSLTFNDQNGAKIYGFEDLAKSIAQLRREVDSLKRVLSRIPVDSSLFTHEYVDLGLPSGTLWATCNVGAKTPSDYGYYICWGETDQKSNYALQGGKWNDYDIPSLKANNVIDQYFNLTSRYDAATVLWGEDWRIPTSGEIDELLNYCTQQWTEINGINGILFTSSYNSKSIFLPCSGMIRDNVETMVGTRGYYIGSTATNGNFSSGLYLAQDDIRPSSTSRSHGRTIRAVRKRANDRPFVDPNDTIINGHAYVDLGLPSGTLWATLNLGADSVQKIGNRYLWGFPSTEIPFDAENGWKGASLDHLVQYNVTDSTGTLLADRDAATESWGGQWRMPTHEECEELLAHCQTEFVTYNGVTCCKVTGRNGHVMYVPSTDDNGCSAWSSSIYSTTNDTRSYTFHIFNPVLIEDWTNDFAERNKLLPIRPVVNR